MTPEQLKKILASVETLEAWAGGLMDQCTKTKKLIEQAGAVSTAAKGRPQALTAKQLAELSAKRRARLIKK